MLLFFPFALRHTMNVGSNIFVIDDVLSDIASESEDLLGLDHPDKNGRNGWGRSNGPEIRIR